MGVSFFSTSTSTFLLLLHHLSSCSFRFSYLDAVDTSVRHVGSEDISLKSQDGWVNDGFFRRWSIFGPAFHFQTQRLAPWWFLNDRHGQPAVYIHPEELLLVDLRPSHPAAEPLSALTTALLPAS
ncbi:uncharacterized protein ARB_03493 [Trichophyton benhamiae CBS 112371]|uniref:Uncharacterized protein n=1 Tax=Arthroderma benhamiae (strain ATCC MYA-4681 / CBS 112371) TaxID=663331 RepID=D4B4V3_ARTBC|nr:uncharacterized protein ARB_03493 [Trichophyton benhamiae CBS 112371]EFE29598.1 hypothetical protein ARB_03493 [Trichophyton benhamiae CBS 112371]